MLQNIQRKKDSIFEKSKKKKEGIFIQHVKNYHSYNALDFDINIFNRKFRALLFYINYKLISFTFVIYRYNKLLKFHEDIFWNTLEDFAVIYNGCSEYKQAVNEQIEIQVIVVVQLTWDFKLELDLKRYDRRE